MLKQKQKPQYTTHTRSPDRGPDPAARKAGALLILVAFATVVAVIGRVAAATDLPTHAESLAAIALNSPLYGMGGAARLVSGVALLAAAWYLSRTWINRERLGGPIVPILFAVSGIFTAISGAFALVLVPYAPDVSSFTETTETLRWFTGSVGFAFAGIVLLAASLYLWKAGGSLRLMAPASAILGLGMQLIWIDAATILHRITGPLFVIWLLVIAAMLLTGRIERQSTEYTRPER